MVVLIDSYILLCPPVMLSLPYSAPLGHKYVEGEAGQVIEHRVFPDRSEFHPHGEFNPILDLRATS